MIGNIVYFLILAFLTILVFTVFLVVLGLLASWILRVFFKKPENPEDDYGPVFGQVPTWEPIPLSTQISVFTVLILSGFASLPISQWALKQSGITAPWMKPVTPEGYEERRKKAENDFLSRVQSLEASIQETKLENDRVRAEHDRVMNDLRATKKALSDLQKLTDEERQAIANSSSKNKDLAYWSGVSQSIVASVIVAIAASMWKHAHGRYKKSSSGASADRQNN